MSYPERNPASRYALTLKEVREFGRGPLVFAKFQDVPSGQVGVAATIRVNLIGVRQQFTNSQHQVVFLDRKLPIDMTWDASPTGNRWTYEFHELGLAPQMMGRRGAFWVDLPCLILPKDVGRFTREFPKSNPWAP